MIGSRRLVVAGLLCGLLSGGAAAEPVAASRGTWTGQVSAGASGWPSGKVELRVEGGESRFSVNLAGPGGSLLTSEFQAGNRTGVFEPPGTGGLRSLMPFFGRGNAPNPLEGKPLLWARRAGEELLVYRLELQGGPYRLDRLVLTPAGTRLELAFERRAHDRPLERFSASLERRQP